MLSSKPVVTSLVARLPAGVAAGLLTGNRAVGKGLSKVGDDAECSRLWDSYPGLQYCNTLGVYIDRMLLTVDSIAEKR